MDRRTSSPRPGPGRPSVARRVLYQDFAAALTRVSRRELGALFCKPESVAAGIRSGDAFAATANFLDRLRAVAALVGYAGPIIGEALPMPTTAPVDVTVSGYTWQLDDGYYYRDGIHVFRSQVPKSVVAALLRARSDR